MTTALVHCPRPVWYRADGRRYASLPDEYGNATGPGKSLSLSMSTRSFPKRPKGVWLDVYGQKRFVLTAARRRFACPTKFEALGSLIASKKRQIKILAARASEAALIKTMAIELKAKEEAAPKRPSTLRELVESAGIDPDNPSPKARNTFTLT